MSRRADAAPHRCSQGGLVLSVPWRPTRRPDPTPTPEPPAELSLPPKMTPPTEPPPEPTLTPELTRRRHTAFAATTLADAAPFTAARATAAKLLPADSLSVYPGVFRELQLNRRDLCRRRRDGQYASAVPCESSSAESALLAIAAAAARLPGCSMSHSSGWP